MSLDYSQTRSFNVGIAIDTSIEAAMIYDDLIYAQKSFGKGYFYRSYDQMGKRFPMLSPMTIRRHIKKLVDAGYISTKIKKVNDAPTCHYQIETFLSTKMVDSKETTKMVDSINKTTIKETKRDFLLSLVQIVNPREKVTSERLSLVNARLKDYSEDEITAAAHAFSKSEWHKENKQMSIDNLLAPSKFGRWYTAINPNAGKTREQLLEEQMP